MTRPLMDNALGNTTSIGEGMNLENQLGLAGKEHIVTSCVETKARIKDIERVRELAERISDRRGDYFHQVVTYFSGRKELRAFSRDVGELVMYLREADRFPRRSDYLSHGTRDPERMKARLSETFALRGTMRMWGYSYKIGQLQVHVCEVENLGNFAELKYVLLQGQDPSEGIDAIYEVMQKLEIKDEDLVHEDYVALEGYPPV